MYCLDANIWVYYLDADLQEHQFVRSEVADLLRSEALFTTTVIQMEVIHYLSNQVANSESTVARFLNLEGTAVAPLTTDDVRRANEILNAHQNTGLGGRDATILAAAERRDVTELWTHDTDMKRVADDSLDIGVHDPVEES
ncbi:type II toxin-antitoxin system VapC family toxin [Natranaeroarchaeum sulfidigenes]|uniref:Ribonuclease VapC n=1 Tax=Natranaeroarchaeum sulfidigenes TaxID=2784880 RepID=A0A897MTE8_9EURY|nr:type II toxin-antitoxin system VapC family toxin [Natranaeroarchaeum sulfidigenes]QSG03804.1 PIN domain containing protein [Natranaeroarchaeum sulfidigenes]